MECAVNATAATVALWTKVEQQTKFFRHFPTHAHLHEQAVLARTLAGPARPPGSRLRSGGWRLWDIADLLFHPPASLAWTFLPPSSVVSGQWYGRPAWRRR